MQTEKVWFYAWLQVSTGVLVHACTSIYACWAVQAQVAVLLNDAVGTFAGGRYEDEDVMVGVILGTGTNACYLEKRANIQHTRLPQHPRSDSMLINTEWGSYYSDILPVCPAMRLRQLHVAQRP